MKRIFLLLLLIALPTVASAKLIEVGEGIEVDYDVMIETDTNEDGRNDQRAYHKKGKLILTMHDTDQDTSYDKWRRYDENLELEMEAIDTDTDGNPDEFSLFEKTGEVFTASSLASSEAVRDRKTASIPFHPVRNSWFWVSLLMVLLLASGQIVLIQKETKKS